MKPSTDPSTARRRYPGGERRIRKPSLVLLTAAALAFAARAFPRRSNGVVVAVAFVAFALEAGQLLVPGRDAGFSDACVKAMGGLWGVFAAQSSYAIKRRLFPERRQVAPPTNPAEVRLNA